MSSLEIIGCSSVIKMSEEKIFTYPEGLEEMLDELEFIPKERRETLFKEFLEVVTGAVL